MQVALNCLADQVNICVRQGNTYQVDLTLTDDVGGAVDPTGWVIRSQIRNKYADEAPPLAEFTETGRVGNVVTLRLEASDTEAIPRSKNEADLYRWDIEVDDGFNVVTVVEGDVYVPGETTRVGD